MAPFHNGTNGSMHDALSVQYLKPFGYSYPELIDWTATSQEELSQRVTSIVNQLYHPLYSSTTASKVRRDNNNQPVGAALAADWEWTLSLSVNQ